MSDRAVVDGLIQHQQHKKRNMILGKFKMTTQVGFCYSKKILTTSDFTQISKYQGLNCVGVLHRSHTFVYATFVLHCILVILANS